MSVTTELSYLAEAILAMELGILLRAILKTSSSLFKRIVHTVKAKTAH